MLPRPCALLAVKAALPRAEAAAVDCLAKAHTGLLHLPADSVEEARHASAAGLLDVESEEGHAACGRFLSALEAAANALGVEVAPRAYRSEFSVNYRALFPGEARHYRADILEEFSADRSASIWVNGEKFELSREVIACGGRLQAAISAAGALLERWRRAAASGPAPSAAASASRPVRSEFVVALAEFDGAWAALEHGYIASLIEIEDRARQLVLRAVEAEQRLSDLEGSKGVVGPHDKNRYRDAQRDLVACVAKLNSVANCRRKGRDDLGCDILDGAFAALSPSLSSQELGTDRRAATLLAGDIVGAFHAIRDYLRHIKAFPERVDPHLCNNAGLVARLVDWEESWEVGGRYVKQVPLLDALCRLVMEIKSFQTLIPRLATMCDECDVEWFMVLPRIVLLAFLKDPAGKLGELLRMLLPHRFQGGTTLAAGGEVATRELQDLLGRFRQTSAALAQVAVASPAEGPAAQEAAWEVLARRVVNGSDAEALNGIGGGILQVQRKQELQTLEAFYLELERWSLELQRHCPEDWNQCSAVLVQCLMGTSKRQKFMKFQV